MRALIFSKLLSEKILILRSNQRETIINVHTFCGPGSSVGIATGHGLDGPGIECRWGARFSAPVQTGPGAHLLYNGYRVFPGGKERPGRDADPSPPSSAVVMKG